MAKGTRGNKAPLNVDALIPVRDLADMFSVRQATVRQWKAQGAPIHKVQGRLMGDPAEVQAWRDKTGRGNERADGKNTPAQHWREVKERALAQRYELELQKMRGDLIERTVANQFVARMAIKYRNEAMGVVSRISAQFPGAEGTRVHEVVDREIRAMLERLANDSDKRDPDLSSD